MSTLIHLIYASAASRRFSPNELQAILSTSRVNNERDGVTGMLLHVEGSFFQVLEGEESMVDAVFTRIAGDVRHQQATSIIREPIESRSFDEWTMGYTSLPNEQVSTMAGFNDFFGTRDCLRELDAGRARKLLEAFASGRWRTRINSTVVGTTAVPAEARAVA